MCGLGSCGIEKLWGASKLEDCLVMGLASCEIVKVWVCQIVGMLSFCKTVKSWDCWRDCQVVGLSSAILKCLRVVWLFCFYSNGIAFLLIVCVSYYQNLNVSDPIMFILPRALQNIFQTIKKYITTCATTMLLNTSMLLHSCVNIL